LSIRNGDIIRSRRRYLAKLVQEREAASVGTLGSRLLAEVKYLLLVLVDLLLLQLKKIVKMRL